MVNSQDLQETRNGSTVDLAICLDSSDDEIEVWESPARTKTATVTQNSDTKKRKRSETVDLASSGRSFDLTEIDDENDDRVQQTSNVVNNLQQSQDEVVNDVKQEISNVVRDNQEYNRDGDYDDGPITPTRKKRSALKTVNSKRPIERQRPNYLANATWTQNEASPQQENVPTPSVARMPSEECMIPKNDQPAHQSSNFGRDSTVSRNWKTTGLDEFESRSHQDTVQFPNNTADEEYGGIKYLNDDVENNFGTSNTKKRGATKSVDSKHSFQTQRASPVEDTSELKPPPTIHETLPTQAASVPSYTQGLEGDMYTSRRKLQRTAKMQITSLNESSLEIAAAKLAEKEIVSNQDEDSDEDAEDELADYTSLTRVEHLTSTTLCQQTGLPILKFTCYGGPDDKIYDFKVTVKQSNIPGAGHGAFLTYLGARVLSPERLILGDELMSMRSYVGEVLKSDDPRLQTMEPIAAIGRDGIGFSLSLHSECFGGVPYIRKDLKAAVPNSSRPIKVKLAYSDPRSLYTEEEIESLISKKRSKRIGHLGIHSESDYSPDDDITFSSWDFMGTLDLGRYGPFRKRDRKIDSFYDIKTFLFPSTEEWGFGAQEKIFGSGQMIDITDDTDGDPHDDARRHIPMYVNEVGHSKAQKNVFIVRGNADEVHYHAMIDKAMKKGDTIELLCNYNKGYESVRERKGYGLGNLDGSEKSDGDDGACIQRNWEERRNVAETVKDETLSLTKVFYLLEWLESIRSQLLQKAEEFIQWANTFPTEADCEATTSPIKAQQLVALRRLQWLAPLFQKKLEKLLQLKDVESLHNPTIPSTSEPIDNCKPNESARSVPMFEEMLNQCYAMIRRMQWESFSECCEILYRHDNLKDVKGKSMKAALGLEMVEELCFEIRDSMKQPLNSSIWCGVAKELTKTLSIVIANISAEERENQNEMKKVLHFIMEQAEDASERIRQAVNDSSYNCRDLEFDSGVPPNIRLGVKDWYRFSGFEAASQFFACNSTTPKGYTAALLEFQAYSDALYLGMESADVASRLRIDCPKSTVVTRAGPIESDTSSELLGFPRSVESLGKINESWYIIWQVVFVVNAFAQKYLAQSDYSLEILCSKVGVSVEQARKAIQRGINDDKDFCKVTPKGASTRSKSGRKMLHVKKARVQKAVNKFKTIGPPRRKVTGHLFWEFVWTALRDKLGWHRENGNRPNDFYLCPPGVTRGKGFKPRVDFFDSVPLILDFLEGDPRWKDREEVKSALSLYERARALREELRGRKKLPKFKDKEEEASFLKGKLEAGT